MSGKDNKSEQERTKKGKVAFLDAIEKSLGVVDAACKIVGISRTTYYEWLKVDSEFKKKVNEVSEITLDFAESELFKQMKLGNVATIIFYLKTKGKKRGYVERQEITGKEGEPIQITGFTYVKPDEDTTND
mgnify:CR=1 FL=1